MWYNQIKWLEGNIKLYSLLQKKNDVNNLNFHVKKLGKWDKTSHKASIKKGKKRDQNNTLKQNTGKFLLEIN